MKFVDEYAKDENRYSKNLLTNLSLLFGDSLTKLYFLKNQLEEE